MGCSSAAEGHGLWTLGRRSAHIWMPKNASRLRAPGRPNESLTAYNRSGCRLHWRPLLEPELCSDHSVGVLDALAQMLSCQPHWFTIAAIDSALNQGKLPLSALASLTRNASRAEREVLAHVDGRAMSGLETAVRLALRAAGFRCQPQVRFDGIGIVDLLVEDCVVVETDGVEWHSGTIALKRDYDRDLALIRRDQTVVRVNFTQVVFELDDVVAGIRSAVAMHRLGPSILRLPSRAQAAGRPLRSVLDPSAAIPGIEA